jgi:hypothetical protein
MKQMFEEFSKIARLSRECVITEKIDGTNAQVLVTPEGELFCGSRTRWITPENDNYGFARWCMEHRSELLTLGAGRHFGEWWGSGIQRGYGLPKGEKRLSLFNVSRWCLFGTVPQKISALNAKEEKFQQVLPSCVGLVPVLYRGLFTTDAVDAALADLKNYGSKAATGFMKPEGVVIFHTAANVMFKKTIEKDETPKSMLA